MAYRTTGELHIDRGSKDEVFIQAADNLDLAILTYTGHPQYTLADAARLVACWNGCEKIANPLLLDRLLCAITQLAAGIEFRMDDPRCAQLDTVRETLKALQQPEVN